MARSRSTAPGAAGGAATASSRPRAQAQHATPAPVQQRDRSRPAPRGARERQAQAAPRASPRGELAAPLLAWFARARRELPWREEPRDPYRTWVSEVMLQQTRVEVVVPYYLRFLARFPSLAALAQAPLDDVLAHWSGLGYYARARNLHRAAQAAVAQHGGELPRHSELLSTLPGFGPYTAAAVASLAFGEDVALVDGNVARVLARVLRLAGDATQARAAAWEAARALLPPGRAGPFNEALMELGATVCTPRAPACPACPLTSLCAARAQGDAEAFPAAKARKERPTLDWAALALVRKGGAVLLARRPAGALFEGMWDLPSVAVPRAEAPPARAGRGQGAFPFAPATRAGCAPFDETAARAAAEVLLAQRLAGTAPARSARSGATPPLQRAGLVEQTLTHRELRVLVFVAHLDGPATAVAPRPAAAARRSSTAARDAAASVDPSEHTRSEHAKGVAAQREPELRWVAPTPAALQQLGLSSLARKCLRVAGFPKG